MRANTVRVAHEVARQQHAAARQEVYWSRVKQGLCGECGAGALPQRRRCATCLAHEVARHQAIYAERKQHGLCTRCGKRPAFLDHVVCPGCYQKQKRALARSKRRKLRLARTMH